jgi:hypothetical protein
LTASSGRLAANAADLLLLPSLPLQGWQNSSHTCTQPRIQVVHCKLLKGGALQAAAAAASASLPARPMHGVAHRPANPVPLLQAVMALWLW